jgi:hypothetical protein
MVSGEMVRECRSKNKKALCHYFESTLHFFDGTLSKKKGED